MGYWSTIDKNQKRIESNTSSIKELENKINVLENALSSKQETYIILDLLKDRIEELEKQDIVNTKLLRFQAKFLQANEYKIYDLEKQLKTMHRNFISCFNDRFDYLYNKKQGEQND